MRLDLETEIRFPSGVRAGFLRKVLLDEDNEVTQIVMATDDFISRNLLVPVEMLREGEGGVVYINLEHDDLDTLEVYEEERIPVAPEGWEMDITTSAMGEVFPATMYEPIMPIIEVPTLEQDAIALTQGTEIWCLDERWGIVDEIIVDESGTVTAFVGRPDDITARDLLIPLELAIETDANRVVLNCSVADLPTYAQPLVNEVEEPEEF
jgi:hypothetical protein